MKKEKYQIKLTSDEVELLYDILTEYTGVRRYVYHVDAKELEAPERIIDKLVPIRSTIGADRMLKKMIEAGKEVITNA